MIQSILAPSIAPIFDVVRLLRRHRDLTWEMAKREITDRYIGQVAGTLWALGHPLVLMAIYVFVFNVVFSARMGGAADVPGDYTVYLLAGLIPWMAFQEALNKSATVMVANSSLVKQVVFPLEILPIKGILSAFLRQLIASALLVVYMLATQGHLPLTILLLPGLWIAQVLATIGICCVVAAVGAYFRDIKDVIQVGCTAGMYIMPIFYQPDWVPETIRPLLYLNPFSYLVWCYQDAIYFGRFAHPWAWLVVAVGSIVVCAVGCRLFQKLKTYLGSVL